MTGAQQSQIEIQTVTFDDLLEAIGQGLRDFKAAPFYGLFFAGIYTLGGWLLVLLEGEFDLPFRLSAGGIFIAFLCGHLTTRLCHITGSGLILVTGFSLFIWLDIAALQPSMSTRRR